MAQIETYAVISVKKEDRLYEFKCSNNAPLGEIYDVIHEMKAFVFQKMKDVEEIKKNEETSNEAS